MDEIESLLLAQETRIEKHIKNLDSNQVVNLTMHDNSNKKAYKGGTSNLNGYQHNYNKNYGQGGRGRSNYYHSRNSGGRSSNRSGRHNWNTNSISKPQCQVCGKSGHIAFDCWHHFDQDF